MKSKIVKITKPKHVDLYEIVVHIEANRGLIMQQNKYKTMFTLKTYLPCFFDVTKDIKDGYNYSLYRRVKATELMKVIKGPTGDKCNNIRRSIYFVEGQEEEAKNLIKDELNATTMWMLDDANKIRNLWINRNTGGTKP